MKPSHSTSVSERPQRDIKLNKLPSKFIASCVTCGWVGSEWYTKGAADEDGREHAAIASRSDL